MYNTTPHVSVFMLSGHVVSVVNNEGVLWPEMDAVISHHWSRWDHSVLAEFWQPEHQRSLVVLFFMWIVITVQSII